MARTIDRTVQLRVLHDLARQLEESARTLQGRAIHLETSRVDGVADLATVLVELTRCAALSTSTRDLWLDLYRRRSP